jgi:transcriptional regulator with XRE-family HTH domain
MDAGRELRQARERRGLSVADVARDARIPARYVEALERNDLSVFGRGPFASGYTRQYRRFLGLPEKPVVEPDPEPEVTATSPTVTSPLIPSRRRLAALLAGFAVVVVLGVLLGRQVSGPPSSDIGVAPDQVVLLTTNEPLKASIRADGRDLFSGVIAPGQQQRFEAHDELALELPRLDGVTLVYNGRTLKPLGAQSRPRRLIFVDDRER